MKHPRLLDLMLMSGLSIEPYGARNIDPTPTETRQLCKSFTGPEYAKRKSRSKIAKESKKRNR